MRYLTAVATLMLLTLFTGCMSFMARNSPPHILEQGEWDTRSTEHFLFYFRPGSRTEQRIDIVMNRQEQNYDEVLELLQANDPDLQIKVFIFPTLEDKVRITSSRTYAHTVANYNTVYCIDRDPIRNVFGKLEITYLLLGKVWGACADGPFSWLLIEGIPVWSAGNWFRTELFEYMEVNLTKGKISTPYDIVIHNKISDRNIHAYPVAGAFIKYLVQRWDLAKLMQLYREGYSQEDFLRIFGLEFSAASEQFMEYCVDPESHDFSLLAPLIPLQ